MLAMIDRLDCAREHVAVRARGIPCYWQAGALYTLNGRRATWIEAKMTSRDWDAVREHVNETRREDLPMGKSRFTGGYRS